MAVNLKVAVYTLVFAVGFPALAHFPIYMEPPDGSGLLDVDWTPIQFGLCPAPPDYPLQLAPGRADVYGVAVGLLMTHQHSAVISASLINAVEENYFLQVGGLFTGCNENFGLEIGFLNMTKRNFGVSVGGFNLESGFGYRSKNDPCPMACGLQIGLVNAGGGVQIGLINIGGKIQIGLVNYNDEALIPLLPIINFTW